MRPLIISVKHSDKHTFCHVTTPNKSAAVSMVRLSQSLFLKLSKPNLRFKIIKNILIMIVIIVHLSEETVYAVQTVKVTIFGSTFTSNDLAVG